MDVGFVLSTRVGKCSVKIDFRIDPDFFGSAKMSIGCYPQFSVIPFRGSNGILVILGNGLSLKFLYSPGVDKSSLSILPVSWTVARMADTATMVWKLVLKIWRTDPSSIE